jgi:molybdate transport system permease protein
LRETLKNQARAAFLSKWIFIFPGLGLAALFVLPLFTLFARALNRDFWAYALDESALHALWLSLLTSTLTTVCAAVFGTPLAYILARWSFRFKTVLQLLLDLPIVLPPSVAGVLLLITFGRRGALGGLLQGVGISLPFTTAAVVLAQLFVAAPLHIRAARIGFGAIDKQLEEAAQVEGAHPWQLFWGVMLPLARRAIGSGLILTWTRAIGEFGATLLFAGNLEGITQTMPMAISLGFERDLGVALALSVVLVLVSFVLLIVTQRLEAAE